RQAGRVRASKLPHHATHRGVMARRSWVFGGGNSALHGAQLHHGNAEVHAPLPRWIRPPDRAGVLHRLTIQVRHALAGLPASSSGRRIVGKGAPWSGEVSTIVDARITKGCRGSLTSGGLGDRTSKIENPLRSVIRTTSKRS